MLVRKNESQIVCIAEFWAKEGEVYPLIADLHQLIKMTLQEGGCLRYELNQCIEDPNKITFLEKWFDQETFELHCNKDYITEFFNNGNPHHVERFQVNMHKEILA